MQKYPLLIIGWEFYPEDFLNCDEEDNPVYTWENIESDCACDFASQIAESIGLEIQMSGFDERYWFTFNRDGVVDVNQQQINEYSKKATKMQKILHKKGLIEKDEEFCVAADINFM
jgi:hypothetical protein